MFFYILYATIGVAFIVFWVSVFELLRFINDQSKTNAFNRHQFFNSEIRDDNLGLRIDKLERRVYVLEDWKAIIDRKLRKE